MDKVFKKGSELDKQIYKEGELSWGCKSGFLDVEDVAKFIDECIDEFYGCDNYSSEIRTPIEARDIMIRKAGEILLSFTFQDNGGEE